MLARDAKYKRPTPCTRLYLPLQMRLPGALVLGQLLYRLGVPIHPGPIPAFSPADVSRLVEAFPPTPCTLAPSLHVRSTEYHPSQSGPYRTPYVQTRGWQGSVGFRGRMGTEIEKKESKENRRASRCPLSPSFRLYRWEATSTSNPPGLLSVTHNPTRANPYLRSSSCQEGGIGTTGSGQWPNYRGRSPLR